MMEKNAQLKMYIAPGIKFTEYGMPTLVTEITFHYNSKRYKYLTVHLSDFLEA